MVSEEVPTVVHSNSKTQCWECVSVKKDKVKMVVHMHVSLSKVEGQMKVELVGSFMEKLLKSESLCMF